MGSGLVIGTTNWVLIERKILSPGGKLISITGIPSGYNMLFVLITGEIVAAAESPEIQFNGSADLIYHQTITSLPVGVGASVTINATQTSFTAPILGTAADTMIQLWISQKSPFGSVRTIFMEGGNETDQRIVTGYWSNVNEVNRIDLITSVNNMVEGSTMAVYGVI